MVLQTHLGNVGSIGGDEVTVSLSPLYGLSYSATLHGLGNFCSLSDFVVAIVVWAE